MDLGKGKKDGVNCTKVEGGVDLNRNFGFMFGSGDSLGQECGGGDTYRGKYAFSEKETQGLKTFLESKKDEIKFVYNFHSAGK
jgi:hypothetical protein